MVFNSFVFAAFFVSVYTLYLLCRRRLALQNAILLVASYFFYGWWDWRFLTLLAGSTVVDFACSIALDRRAAVVTKNRTLELVPHLKKENHPSEKPYAYSSLWRRAILFISIGVNLGVLGFFKYFDFFSTSLAELLQTIGLPIEPRLLRLILPVGISFYTFQTLSYTIDVYRGELRAQRNLLNFAVFVAFFPQLVAGPILRAKDFLPQVIHPRRLNLDQIYEGGYLILWGLFKKVVIADNLAVLVDRVFDAQTPVIGSMVYVAVVAFAFQIYCDFSGYTDIARGCAKMMGFSIPLNFNLPYFASNPQQFWKRWHISLSSWLRDYLYIPLGGNRKGVRRTTINRMLTRVLGGLWHGAAWTFLLWGAYQGVLLVIYKTCSPWVHRQNQSLSPTARLVTRWVGFVIFFHLVCLGWLIFRADSVEQVGGMLFSLIGSPWQVGGNGLTVLLVCLLPLLAVQIGQYVKNDLLLCLHLPAPVRGLWYAAIFYGLILFGSQADQPFIYFQF